jgi:hypothetical protein
MRPRLNFARSEHVDAGVLWRRGGGELAVVERVKREMCEGEQNKVDMSIFVA